MRPFPMPGNKIVEWRATADDDGTIVSPWRHDAMAGSTIGAAHLPIALRHQPCNGFREGRRIYCKNAMCIVVFRYTHSFRTTAMRTNIEIDDALMAEAQKASGHATKKQTVEQALRLMIRLRRQHEVDAAFGKYRWRGNLARSRKGRGTG
jgi:Arc/MetJ family transcription regulator